MGLTLQTIPFKEACAFVEQHHRHHPPPRGHKFSIAAHDGNRVVGVAMVGRPVARGLDDGETLEINRCCTDGTANACSFLYGAAWRASKALGYRKLVTYTLPEEGGASLRASGWTPTAKTSGGSWHTPGAGRLRVDLHPTQEKIRWEAP